MEADQFMLSGVPRPWLGGEPRTFVFNEEDAFPDSWAAINETRMIDVTYSGGGLTRVLDEIVFAAGVSSGSFQAVLENLEDLSQERPLVVVVRRAHKLLADVGPAIIHLICGWEGFTHHGAGISNMYLVLETGPRALVNVAFYPGGAVDWLSSTTS